MSKELREAAERINESLNGGGASLAYPKHRTPADVSNALHAECSMIARAYLAEHPADDEHPADVEAMALSTIDDAFKASLCSSFVVLEDNIVNAKDTEGRSEAAFKFGNAVTLAVYARRVALDQIISSIADREKTQ